VDGRTGAAKMGNALAKLALFLFAFCSRADAQSATPTRTPTHTPTPLAMVVDSTVDAADVLLDGLCATAGLVCTLRAAIQECNNAYSCSITFSASGTLTLGSALPEISKSASIVNANADCGDLLASPPDAPSWPFVVNGGGFSVFDVSDGVLTLKGLHIHNSPGPLRLASNDGGSSVKCMHIEDSAGHGIGIQPGSNGNIIGGTGVGDGNLIHDVFVDCLFLLGDNTEVKGNLIGLLVDGVTASPCEDAVYISDASGTVVGGPGRARNVISGSTHWGVDVDNNSVSTSILGNRIGTDYSGMAPIGNQFDGIMVQRGSSSTTIDGNLISGNELAAIRVDTSGEEDTTITDNLIGTDVSGADDLDLCNQGGFSNQLDDSGTNTTFSGNDLNALCEPATPTPTVTPAPGCCSFPGENGMGATCVDNTVETGITISSMEDCETIGTEILSEAPSAFSATGSCDVPISGSCVSDGPTNTPAATSTRTPTKTPLPADSVVGASFSSTLLNAVSSTTTSQPVLVRGAGKMAVQITASPVCTSYTIEVKHVSDSGSLTISTFTEADAGAGTSYIESLSVGHGYVSASLSAVSGCTLSAYLMVVGGGY